MPGGELVASTSKQALPRLPAPFLSVYESMLTACWAFRHVPFPDSAWITRYFHEKASPCQAVFAAVQTMRLTADQREAR